MGIKNLLKFLDPIARKVSITEYKGKTIGVDAMCWMHRGAIASAESLILGNQKCNRFIQFVMKMVQLLLDTQIRPLLVFDGRQIPAKSYENQARREKRETAVRDVKELIEKGTSRDSRDVQRKLIQAIHVTYEMIQKLLQALRLAGVEFIIAPFEADAELAFLCRARIVDAVITEDSDLLAYGCPHVIYKMDAIGEGKEIDLSEALSCEPMGSLPESHAEEIDEAEDPKGKMKEDSLSEKSSGEESIDGKDLNEELNGNRCELEYTSQSIKQCSNSRTSTLDGWVKTFETMDSAQDCRRQNTSNTTLKKKELNVKENTKPRLLSDLAKMSLKMFSAMCVLSGSDYTNEKHIQGIGTKIATQLILRYRSLESVLKNLIIDLKWRKRILQNYPNIDPNTSQPIGWDDVVKAHLIGAIVFQHHRVYDPRNNQIKEVGTDQLNNAKPSSLATTATILGVVVSMETILGKIQMDPFKLFQEVSGEIDVKTGKTRFDNYSKPSFTMEETNTINIVGKKERELAEIRQWDKDLTDKLSLEKFKRLFGEKDEKQRFVENGYGSKGGGTGLMEREAMKCDAINHGTCNDGKLSHDSCGDENATGRKMKTKRKPLDEERFMELMTYFDESPKEVKNVRKRTRFAHIIENNAESDDEEVEKKKRRYSTPIPSTGRWTTRQPSLSFSEELRLARYDTGDRVSTQQPFLDGREPEEEFVDERRAVLLQIKPKPTTKQEGSQTKDLLDGCNRSWGNIFNLKQ